MDLSDPAGSQILRRASSVSKDSGATVALFGLPVSNLTMPEAVAQIGEWIDSGTTHQVVTANLDFARNARENEFLHRIICGCSMVLPDGAALLWASRILRRPLKERITGVDLVPQLARLSAARGYGIYLLGSSPENSAAARKTLEQRYPGARFVGSYSPPVAPLDRMDNDGILSRIHAANPDILLVAFGNPKQEIWISRNFHQLQIPVVIGIGGSLDMISGSLKRAPKWIQNLQIEWVFRMLQEPRRLFPRYAHDVAALIKFLPGEILANRRQPSRGRGLSLTVEQLGNHRLARTPEVLTGEHCASLLASASTAADHGEMLILDMAKTARVEADGVGCLIEARRILMIARQPVWLTSVSLPVRRVLETTNLFDMFRTALTPQDAIRLASQGLPHPDRRMRPRVVSGSPLAHRYEEAEANTQAETSFR